MTNKEFAACFEPSRVYEENGITIYIWNDDKLPPTKVWTGEEVDQAA